MIAGMKLRAGGLGVAGFALLGALLAPAPALAMAHGTLTFDQATGTATTTDSIPVYFSFTLDADSEPLQTGPGGVAILGGPTDDEIAALGFDLSQDHSVGMTVSYTCTGNFNVCSENPPYDFSFNFDPPSFLGREVALAPGESINNVLFGTFTPHGGSAPAGDYTFHTASLAFYVSGFDGDGNSKGDFTTFVIATTCAYGDDACAFSRSVTPVPEPGEWAMMAAGLAVVGGVARRRSREAA